MKTLRSPNESFRLAHGHGITTSACDAVDGSSTGIAMCHIVVSLDGKRMSPLGTKPTFSGC